MTEYANVMQNDVAGVARQPQVIMVEKPRNGLATAAMVLGIIAMVFAFIPVVNMISIVLAVIGLGLVIPAFIKARKVKVGLGKAIAALVLAVASMITFTAVNATVVAAVDEAVSEISTSADDVAITFGEATTDEFGMTEVQVTVENVGEDTESPLITIAATSPDGTVQYETTSVIISDLAPGQTATETAMFLEEIPADAEFSATDVL